MRKVFFFSDKLPYFAAGCLAAIATVVLCFFLWMKQCDTFLSQTRVSGRFIIEKGQPYSAIHNQLFRGLHTPAALKIYLTKILKVDKKMRYGFYEANNTSLAILIDNITKGHQTLIKVTFPEGYNMYDVAFTLENASIALRDEMLTVFMDRELVIKLTGTAYESLEGFLAPGTYFFPKNYPPEKIASTMVNEFYKSLPIDFEEKAKQQGLSFYDALILASIVQKETYNELEAPLVAAVFINRIKKKMLIQADPTIIYGKYTEYNGRITKADLTDRSNRYNTYRHKGLPPTPISNPSKMALNAVANPIKSDYIYFVATKDGKHIFSESYDEHRRNVNIHQKGWKN